MRRQMRFAIRFGCALALMFAANANAAAESAAGAVKVSSRFGRNPEDATANLQAALDSGLPEIIVDKTDTPWIAGPLRGRSNQTIVFEDGVEILAKQGAFRATGDALMLFAGCSNVVLRGRGTLRMRKRDYQNPPYQHSEWRHALSLRSCTNILVDGLTMAESGGDGIYLGVVGWQGDGMPNRNIAIRNVVCDANHRQGISVISAENLLIEACAFINTKGTPPEDGIDFEPNSPGQPLENCIVRNCMFKNNAGRAIEVVLYQYDAASRPVSIRIASCTSDGDIGGVRYLGAKNDILVPADDGTVEIIDSTFANAQGSAFSIARAPFASGRIAFRNCMFDNCCAQKPETPDVSVLVSGHEIYAADAVSFENVTIRQGRARAWLSPPMEDAYRGAPTRISGEVTVETPDGAKTRHVLDDAWRAARYPAKPGKAVERLPSVPLNASRMVVCDAAPGRSVPLSSICVRGRNSYAFHASAARTVRFTVRQLIVGTRQAVPLSLQFRRYAEKKPFATRQAVAASASETLSLEVPAPGFYAIDVLGTGGNGLAFLESDVPLALDVTRNMAALIFPEGELYVAVAPGERFGLFGLGDGAENFSGTVYAPSGREEYRQECSFGAFYHASPKDSAPGLWRVRIGKPKKGILEDVRLQVTGVPGFFFLSPEKYWTTADGSASGKIRE